MSERWQPPHAPVSVGNQYNKRIAVGYFPMYEIFLQKGKVQRNINASTY